MLDHVFLDTVEALQAALDDTLLHRQRHDDRLAMDMLLGDIVWETSVTLPGENDPPRVRADLNLDWPTWSQSAWRSVVLGETLEDPPEIGVEIVFRVQRLAEQPELGRILACLPAESPMVGTEPLQRSGPVLEVSHESYPDGDKSIAVEVAYEGSYRLDEEVAALGQASGSDSPSLRLHGASLDPQLATTHSGRTTTGMAGLGSWVASTLVRLADLKLRYLPAESDEA